MWFVSVHFDSSFLFNQIGIYLNWKVKRRIRFFIVISFPPTINIFCIFLCMISVWSRLYIFFVFVVVINLFAVLCRRYSLSSDCDCVRVILFFFHLKFFSLVIRSVFFSPPNIPTGDHIFGCVVIFLCGAVKNHRNGFIIDFK